MCHPAVVHAPSPVFTRTILTLCILFQSSVSFSSASWILYFFLCHRRFIFTNISMYLMPRLILQWIFIMHWWGRTAASHVRMVHDSVCMLPSWHQFTPLIGHRLVTKAMIKPPLCLKVDHSVCYRTVFAQFRVRQTMTIVLFMASYVGLLNRQSSVFLPLKWV